MSDLSKVQLNGIEYNLKDAEARLRISALSEDILAEVPLASTT